MREKEERKTGVLKNRHAPIQTKAIDDSNRKRSSEKKKIRFLRQKFFFGKTKKIFILLRNKK